MNQIELANRLGRTQGFVSKFLNGHAGCSLETAEKLSDLFGHDPLWWMKSTAKQRKAVLGNGNGHNKTG
jgi:plasmid maintenance system antidote protein VapI